MDQEKKQILDLFQSDATYRNSEKQIRENCVVQFQIAKYDIKLKDHPMIIYAGKCRTCC